MYVLHVPFIDLCSNCTVKFSHMVNLTFNVQEMKFVSEMTYLRFLMLSDEFNALHYVSFLFMLRLCVEVRTEILRTMLQPDNR